MMNHDMPLVQITLTDCTRLFVVSRFPATTITVHPLHQSLHFLSPPGNECGQRWQLHLQE